MNAAQANAISLPEILSKLGYPPQKERGRDLLYFSPFREERTPSFHVNAVDNIWYDFGAELGGDVVDFASAYLESRGLDHSVSEALRFLGENFPAGEQALSLPRHAFNEKAQAGAPTLEIVDVHPLRHVLLLRYLLNDRRIPLDLARKYLVEIKVRNRNTGKTFSAVGMKNADKGYELRNAFFKGCLGHKDVTVIRGAEYPPREVHVFEGFMDLLSALADQEIETFAGDVIVLHSLACLSKALPYIEHYENYKRLFSWLDNDRAGEKASRFLQRITEQQHHLDFCAMNKTYAPHKDVNEARVMRLGLPLLR